MTSEPVTEPEIVEQTRLHIRQIAGEIAIAARSDIEPAAFYRTLLDCTVTALAGVGGALWQSDDEGRLRLLQARNMEEIGLSDTSPQSTWHDRVLQHANDSEQGVVLDPHSEGIGEQQAANPTDYALLIAPIGREPAKAGLLEIVQHGQIGTLSKLGYLRFLRQICEIALTYFTRHEVRTLSERKALWNQVEQFTQAVHESLDVSETCYTIANEGRRLIDCDRVSVAVRQGRKCTIEAVSGQDTLERRANSIVLLSQLVNVVLRSGEALWYRGDTHDLPPQIEQAVDAYADETHTKMIAVLPLVCTAPEEAPEEAAEDKQLNREILGALVVEQLGRAGASEPFRHRTATVHAHSERALCNALDHSRLFLMPLWRMLGKARWVVRARTLPKTIAIAVLLVAAVLALVFVPADFELQARGTLEPAQRRDVFVQVDGVVSEINVKHGQKVRVDAKLMTIHSRDLEVSVSDVGGRRTATREQIAALRRALNEKGIRHEERNRLAGQLMQLRKTYSSLVEQHQLLLQKKELLTLKSSIAGRVVSWDLENRLAHRPVQVGQIVMTIANPDGPWELELRMPEDAMGHIARAQRQLDNENKDVKSADKRKRLGVTYILATDPGTARQGEVEEIEAGAEVRGEEGNTVLIRVQIERGDLRPEDLRPGATVTAKVYCGRRSLGYVWFHDVLAFIQSRILFRF